jgi:hypothetical protein
VAGADGFDYRMRKSRPRAAFDQVPGEQASHRLYAKGSGLHRVLEEVGLKVPIAGVHVLLGAQPAQSLTGRQVQTYPESTKAADLGDPRPDVDDDDAPLRTWFATVLAKEVVTAADR